MAEAAATTAGEAPAAPAARLDDMMLAMDVVDTLRHQEQLVAEELGQDTRDAALKKRLRQIYESQGLEVSDRILDQGIVALKESRFVYRPPPGGLATVLAHLWVRRRAVGVLVAALAVIVVGAWGWQAVQGDAARRSAEASRIEVTETLPAAFRQAGAAATAAASDPAAVAEVDKAIAAGNAAVAAGDAAAMRRAIADLGALRARLNQAYQLRIVARPGEDTGVFRIPDVNQSARNYYIVVEAVDDRGTVVSLPITSEEDGSVKTVAKWAVRVPEATFNAVRDDKADDGIVQNSVLGEKRRGTLAVDYRMAVAGGAITGW
jgi:hypothetical protein